MLVVGDDRKDDVPPLDNVIEDLLLPEANAEHDMDLQDIQCSGPIDVGSSLWGDFSKHFRVISFVGLPRARFHNVSLVLLFRAENYRKIL